MMGNFKILAKALAPHHWYLHCTCVGAALDTPVLLTGEWLWYGEYWCADSRLLLRFWRCCALCCCVRCGGCGDFWRLVCSCVFGCCWIIRCCWDFWVVFFGCFCCWSCCCAFSSCCCSCLKRERAKNRPRTALRLPSRISGWRSDTKNTKIMYPCRKCNFIWESEKIVTEWAFNPHPFPQTSFPKGKIYASDVGSIDVWQSCSWNYVLCLLIKTLKFWHIWMKIRTLSLLAMDKSFQSCNQT